MRAIAASALCADDLGKEIVASGPGYHFGGVLLGLSSAASGIRSYSSGQLVHTQLGNIELTFHQGAVSVPPSATVELR